MKDIRCLLGLHTGANSPGAGLIMYTCPRCKGSFWQRHDHRAALAAADAAILRDDLEAAEEIKAAALGHQPEDVVRCPAWAWGDFKDLADPLVCPECGLSVGDDDELVLVGDQRWHRYCLTAFEEWRECVEGEESS